MHPVMKMTCAALQWKQEVKGITATTLFTFFSNGKSSGGEGNVRGKCPGFNNNSFNYHLDR